MCALKLIVEAGTTKTDSVLIGSDGTQDVIIQSAGINPVTDINHHHAVKELLRPYLQKPIKEICYYGSGCINDDVNNTLAEHIQSYFDTKMNITIDDDLVAVGNGLCQNEPGIVSILGTGSNTGYYDGKLIIDGIKSCGYLIGDEGSGFSMGQSVLRRFARKNLPVDLIDLIEEQYGLKVDDAVANIYNSDNIRQYVASFAKVVKQLSSPLKNELIGEVFEPFVKQHLLPMTQRYSAPIHLSGSIAFHFEAELRDMLEKFNIIAGSIHKSPLAGLISYHSLWKRK